MRSCRQQEHTLVVVVFLWSQKGAGLKTTMKIQTKTKNENENESMLG